MYYLKTITVLFISVSYNDIRILIINFQVQAKSIFHGMEWAVLISITEDLI